MSAFYWICIAIVVITSSARLTRLITFDKFPPIAWVREKFLGATDGSNWQLLGLCGYCMSFWVTAGVIIWGWLVDFNEPWWLVNAIFGASYMAAIMMRYDGDEGDEN